jgi:hypothetical protein
MISYGRKCDAEFLANYGFVPFNNSKQKCWELANETALTKNVTGEALHELLKQQQKNRTEWRGRWRGHFARFYMNLARAQVVCWHSRSLLPLHWVSFDTGQLILLLHSLLTSTL